MLDYDLIEDIKRNNDKLGFLLDEWIVEYGFREKPDPRAAIEWGCNNRDDHLGNTSAKWFFEYNRIYKLIDMAHDYYITINDLVEKTLEEQHKGKY